MKYLGKGMADSYERFQSFDQQFHLGSRTNTEMQVRRVTRGGREETQVAVSLYTNYQKSKRLVTTMDSFTMTPKDSLLLAFALAPELKTMVGDLIFGTDNDLIQPAIDRCNKIVDIVGCEAFQA